MIIQPQQGFQEKFISSVADVAWGGGAAGCGKTRALLHFPLSAMKIPDFYSVIFRREMTQVSIAGGLWDEAVSLYSSVLNYQPVFREHKKEVEWPSRAKLKFAHLEHANDVLKYQGMQAPFIGLDELTHFLETQYWYITSRNRSAVYEFPFVRATTNPQGDGWVKKAISWYLYPEDYSDQSAADFPILERSGVLRHYQRFDGMTLWGNNCSEVLDQIPTGRDKKNVKSFTFINGTLDENVILNKANPGYRATLESLSETDRMQLLLGRWRSANEEQSLLFDRSAVYDIDTNTFVHRTGKRCLTADIALEGRDEMVILAWDGWVIVDALIIAKSDGAQVIEHIRSMQTKWRVADRYVVFDADGLGGFVKGYIRSSLPFNGNGGVIPVNGQKEKYKNLRAQCYYYAAKKVNDSDLYYPKDLPRFKDICKELLSIKKEYIKDEFCVSSKSEIKARLGNSPNFADAIMMRSLIDLQVSGGSYSAMNT